MIMKLQVRLPASLLSSTNVFTYVTVASQYNLVPAKRRWHFVAGKVTVGLCFALSGLSFLQAQWPEGEMSSRWAQPCFWPVRACQCCIFAWCCGCVFQMTNPSVQNDFSYYRRTLSRMKMASNVSLNPYLLGGCMIVFKLMLEAYIFHLFKSWMPWCLLSHYLLSVRDSKLTYSSNHFSD